MKWENISILITLLGNDLTAQGYFFQSNNQTIQNQTSIVRSNCMDCLDRTNVVQSVIARIFLTRQLRSIQVLSQNQEIDGEFEYIFNNVWADNADAISLQYSGSGALKTDFTRTGKRNVHGVLNDLSNSIIRYVKNNFLDGTRQDEFDLFLGNYKIGNTSPFKNSSVDNSALVLVPLINLVYCLLYYSSSFNHLFFNENV